MNRLICHVAMLSLITSIASCGGENKQPSTENSATMIKQGVTTKDWGETDGKKVQLFTLTNKNGVTVSITNYGGIVTSWVTPDKHGNRSSVVVGLDSLQDYLKKPPYFGALIGRYGNRIGDAKFKLDGKTYTLAANNGKNNLHGGNKGFDKVVWDATPAADSTPALTLSYLSKDGEEGFPGNLKVTVVYTLTDADELNIEYTAETDKATPVNLTNHSYFNLTGSTENTILNHSLQLVADHFTPVDTTLIPTGEIKAVAGTPFDFTKPEVIGSRIDAVPGAAPGGYDHNYVINRKDSSLQLVATLTDTTSGRKLEVFTTEPGIQFYSGNFLNGTFVSGGKPVNFRTALCLETQHFPDSPNKPNFPTTILQPNQKYHSVTKYKVSLQ
ncbi:galactose mutarotase [Niastella vici]|uniref:Aldose 1-epimerase n=1 Tax=Niastella vici TaxID=1703345 RepID=A0A1V9FWS1_9BACT|nr:aldose epimerase family protein [Niastella vici]OQP62819.1 galactose mutarotase [Niastella vici]